MSQENQNISPSYNPTVDKIITLDNLNYFFELLKKYFKATDSTFGGFKTGYTQTGKNYPVKLAGDNAYVNVPWIDSRATEGSDGLMSSTDKKKLNGIAEGANKYVLPTATSSSLGGIKIGYTQTDKNYPVQLSDGKAYVNVPWTDNNTTYSNATQSTAGLMSTGDKKKLDGIAEGANKYSLPTASSSTLGGVKIGYTTANKNYAVQLDGNNNAYVSVPWIDSQATEGTDGLMSYADKMKLNGIEANANNFELGSAKDDEYGGIRTGYKDNGKNYAVKLDDGGKAYVNVPWTDTNTDTDTVPGIEITHAGLVDLINKSKLITGRTYRITDYAGEIAVVGQWGGAQLQGYTFYGNASVTSAGNRFDIIVKAISPNTLSEDAKACLHEGDTYFQYCNLSAWELKYNYRQSSNFLNKRITSWAGDKGVIYYMKDEFGNEAPYDFKNIKFDNKYTFHNDNNTWKGDGTVPKSSIYQCPLFWNNVIKPYYAIGTNAVGDATGPCTILLLNNIVMIQNNNIGKLASNKSLYDHNNDQQYKITKNNTFDNNCGNITIYAGASNNKFDDGCNNITIGSYSNNNNFKNNCSNIVLHGNSENNSFSDCSDIRFNIYQITALGTGKSFDGSTQGLLIGSIYINPAASNAAMIADVSSGTSTTSSGVSSGTSVDQNTTIGSTNGSIVDNNSSITLPDSILNHLFNTHYIPIRNCTFKNTKNAVIYINNIYVNGQQYTNYTTSKNFSKYCDYICKSAGSTPSTHNTSDLYWNNTFNRYMFKYVDMTDKSEMININSTGNSNLPLGREFETQILNIGNGKFGQYYFDSTGLKNLPA